MSTPDPTSATAGANVLGAVGVQGRGRRRSYRQTGQRRRLARCSQCSWVRAVVSWKPQVGQEAI